ncbi:Rqc2 family fibronectin-binding protein [Candidatus Xianfuyuplasma coldseepsis]|uniref:Rqc2 homolog RqcH n=1 Tax=Candidatus Xianfuyuplasma coldseepsis TaxID=2782163 RepID=A0A7L7KS42_9MOLU|nr:NFACT RNA binding domain-containing protein [Xianfuyuplasma coldseepsis]QMS85553.1 fibronectin/fibrinogen-binding protein [Xianfuyuplasma coldseepsis]
MSFDGNIIRHLVDEWKQVLLEGRVQKIYQISRFDLLFIIHQNRKKHQFLISSSPRYARSYISTRNYDKPESPPTFCMFLRKQLIGGIIRDIQQFEHDRVIVFSIEKRNELGDLTTKQMILEMMGRYSNIIVTNEDGKILEAIKHSLPFDTENRTIFPGAIYETPSSTKINPYDSEKLHKFLSNPENINYRTLLQNIMGFSPLAIHEVLYRFETEQQSLHDIFQTILTTSNPTMITAKKDQFYHIDLHHVKGIRTHYNSVNELLDDFYVDRDKVDMVKQYAKELTTFVKNSIHRLQHKIDKLAIDLEQTKTMDEYRIKGELIQANLHHLQKGEDHIECLNYYTNEIVVIPLDPTKTPVQNSAQYFKKYKKMKTSIPYIKRQIASAHKELEYFMELESQFDYASLRDIAEIKDELIDKKYLRGHRSKQKRNKPNFDTYIDASGIEIIVGKNNLQNALITHKLAKHNDVWFHVQNAPGSHVIVRQSLPLEEGTIRTAANLAAYYSKMRQSSSVAVDYTEVRNIKKIPGKTANFVTYKNQKTIYIDPDEQLILALKKA